jgi:hypothetical protein
LFFSRQWCIIYQVEESIAKTARRKVLANTRRNFKDSVFTSYFNDQRKLIEIYNAIGNKSYPLDTEVKINTLDDALYLGRQNDVSFLLGKKLIILIEHMSTICLNLPLRMNLYQARLYEQMFPSNDIFKRKRIKLPKPEFIVLYNGSEEFPDQGEMKLSDSFLTEDGPVQLDLTVKIYNINQGRNPDILAKSKSLGHYSAFIGRAKWNLATGMSLNEAVAEAIRYCIDNDIMKEFLEKNRSEAGNMLFTEFKMEDALEVRFEEGVETGFEEGVEKTKKETAKAALAKGISPSLVADITGLPLETIEQLSID